MRNTLLASVAGAALLTASPGLAQSAANDRSQSATSVTNSNQESSRYNYFSGNPTGNIRARMRAYFILDLRPDLSLGEGLESGARITDITDQGAILAESSNAFNASPSYHVLNDAAVVAQPRTYGVSFTERF